LSGRFTEESIENNTVIGKQTLKKWMHHGQILLVVIHGAVEGLPGK
jgi:hypothetical protein